MKKICVLLLALFLVFAALGCDKKDDEKKANLDSESMSDVTYAVGDNETDIGTGPSDTRKDEKNEVPNGTTLTINGKSPENVLIFVGEYGSSFIETITSAFSSNLGIKAEMTADENSANVTFVKESDLIPKGKFGIAAMGEKLLIVANNETEADFVSKKLVALLSESGGAIAFDGLVYSEESLSDKDIKLMNQLIIYKEFPKEIRRIYDYDVTVTMGKRTEKLPVYNHTVESNVSRRPGVDMYRRFAAFAFGEGSVRVDIKVKTDFTSYTVFPSAKGLKHSFDNGVISVYLDKPEYFGVQLDDDQNSIISIMADYPETEVPKKGDKNVLYIDGWYETENGLLDITEPGTTVYLAPGSVVNARVTVSADNCKFIGRGAIVDPFEDIYNYDIREGGTEGSGRKMLIIKGSNCLADGVFMLDSRCFNLLVDGTNNIARNIKVFSSMMTTDGITATGKKMTVERCYYYCGDNGIVFSAKDSTFRDIAIGTTCAGIFPQGSPENDLFEDIYIFRADDGIITNRYNGSTPGKNHQKESVIFRRLSAMEIPSGSTHFFQCGNMGTLEKKFTFEQISIPAVTKAIQYRNDADYLYSNNYHLSFVDFCIDGEVITDPSDVVIENSAKAENTNTFKSSGKFKSVKRNVVIVNYSAKDKIYIGQRQVFLSGDYVKKDGKILLPTKEICALLRVLPISGAEYVSFDELLSAKVVREAKEAHGSIYLVPVYTGKNLLLEDSGEISYYAEHSCYQLELVTSEDRDGIIYTIYSNPKSKSTTAGISRRITDEIRMYGTGTYRVSFSAKAIESGSLKFTFNSDSKITFAQTFGVSEDWNNISFEIKVDESSLTAEKCILVFNGSDRVIDEFSFRDISMTKVK